MRRKRIGRNYNIASLDAESGEGGGEAEAARAGLPPGEGRGAGGDDGGSVGVDERGALEEAEGRGWRRRARCLPWPPQTTNSLGIRRRAKGRMETS
jgi:hypothetical protein